MRKFFCFIVTILTISTATAHDSWINRKGLKNPVDGSLCCGEGDCGMLDPGSVKLTSQGYEIHGFVTIDGTGARERVDEVVPMSEAQPSPDGESWRCKRYDGSRRCFFTPPFGS